MLRASLRNMPPSKPAARKKHFVRPRINQRLAHFPAALHDRHEVRRKSCIAEELLDARIRRTQV